MSAIFARPLFPALAWTGHPHILYGAFLEAPLNEPTKTLGLAARRRVVTDSKEEMDGPRS